MGAYASFAKYKAKQRSEEIDRQIEEDSRKFRKECKILLLGSGESGKTTIIKQIKIVYQNGYTDAELSVFRVPVYRNLLDSVNAVITAMGTLGLDPQEPQNRKYVDIISAYKPEFDTKFIISEEICLAIESLWKDPVIPQVMDQTNDLDVIISAPYFLSEVVRISNSEYLPNVDDVLRVREESTGIFETRFNLGQLSIHMLDIGNQRSERKKWIHCFESITSIIFCTALSEYDQVLLEDGSQSRMQESLVLFESVVNSRWFSRTSIILFLTKIDVFKVKLPKVPLNKYFPEYTGGTDINKAAKYILWKFVQSNRTMLSIYPHLSQATDTSSVRLIFTAVKETLLQNAFRESGIL